MATRLHAGPADCLTDEEIQPWRSVPVAVAVDLVPDQQIDPQIRPLNPPGKQPRLFGRAVTAHCVPEDIGAVIHALEVLKPGDVLVIAAAGRSDTAAIGEILSGEARRRGAVGLVCDGAVRDVRELSSWSDFSVFCRCINPRGPNGLEHGDVNAPVLIGGCEVLPGDLIIGDDDGLAALSPAAVRTRIEEARAKLALEQRWIEALEAGAPVAEAFQIPLAKDLR